jgi:hypothetical protein
MHDASPQRSHVRFIILLRSHQGLLWSQFQKLVHQRSPIPSNRSNTSMGAGPVKSSTRKMEALFRPTSCFRARLQGRWRASSFLHWRDVELLPGLTIENVLAAGITWEEFWRFLDDGNVVWMTPDVYVHTCWSQTHNPRVFQLGANACTSPLVSVYVRSDTAAVEAVATCNFLVRLLAASEQDDVCITGSYNANVPSPCPPLSGQTLSLFFQESRVSLRKVTLFRMVLSVDQCLALATMSSRLDVEVTIQSCCLVDGAAGAFVECLQSDRGPVELHNCKIDSRIIASALTGNSRVTRIKPSPVTNDADMAILFAALASNRGLLDLVLHDHAISDDNWTIMCESLKAHPTLTSLNLNSTSPSNPTGRSLLTGEQKQQRTRLLAEMVQHNTLLHTICLWEGQRDQQIYTEDILPYLETNRYRPRVHASRKADISLRRALLGRALQTKSVRNDSNLLWIFISGNADVLVRSIE